MKRISSIALLTNIVLAMVFGMATQAVAGINGLAVGGAVLSLGTVPQLIFTNALPSGIARMALQTEVWISDIQEQLYANNDFIMKSLNDSAFVQHKTVHVPQAGGAPAVAVDRNSFPATISERTDTELTYNLREFSTDPSLIRDVDEIQVSYAKRQSILASHLDIMNEKIALHTMFSWSAPSANVVKTSGTDSTEVVPAGATGSRKALTLADIRNVALAFDKQNVPKNDRYLLLPSDMYYQLLADNAVLNADTMGKPNLPKGVVKELYGLNIMTRSATTIYDGSFEPKAVGSAGAGTDRFAGIAWQKNYVSNAKGAIKVFADEDKPEYYGSIFSAMVLHGSSKRRSDNKGLVALAQETGA